MKIVKQGWTLVHTETKQAVETKELTHTRDGEAWVIEGGTPPHKPSSSARVWVRLLDNAEWNREFFPNVFNMEWKLND